MATNIHLEHFSDTESNILAGIDSLQAGILDPDSSPSTSSAFFDWVWADNGATELHWINKFENITSGVETYKDIDFDDITARGSLYASDYLYHYGDTDTRIAFADDSITITAGGVNMIVFTEGASDYMTFGADIRIGANSISNDGDGGITIDGDGNITVTGDTTVYANSPVLKVETNSGVAGGGQIWITASGANSVDNAANIRFHNAGNIWGQTTSSNGLYFGTYDRATTHMRLATDSTAYLYGDIIATGSKFIFGDDTFSDSANYPFEVVDNALFASSVRIDYTLGIGVDYDLDYKLKVAGATYLSGELIVYNSAVDSARTIRICNADSGITAGSGLELTFDSNAPASIISSYGGTYGGNLVFRSESGYVIHQSLGLTEWINGLVWSDTSCNLSYYYNSGSDNDREIRMALNQHGMFLQNSGLRVSSGEITTNPGDGKIVVDYSDAGTSDIINMLTLTRTTSGTAAAEFGAGILFQQEDAGGTTRDTVRLLSQWRTGSSGSAKSQLEVQTTNAAGSLQDTLKIYYDGTDTVLSPGTGALKISSTLFPNVGIKHKTGEITDNSGTKVAGIDYSSNYVWNPTAEDGALTIRVITSVSEGITIFVYNGGATYNITMDFSTSDDGGPADGETIAPGKGKWFHKDTNLDWICICN